MSKPTIDRDVDERREKLPLDSDVLDDDPAVSKPTIDRNP
jgi:hypothetical protein